jgi:hypothetical protein
MTSEKLRSGVIEIAIRNPKFEIRNPSRRLRRDWEPQVVVRQAEILTDDG